MAKQSVKAIAHQAEVAYKNEDLTRSIALYRKALKHDKNDPELLKRYGHVLALAGYGTQSVEALTKACKRRPNHPPTLMIMAFAQLRTNNPDGALAALNRALVQDPHYAPALLAKTNLFIDSGESQRAEGILDEALALANPEPMVLVARLKLARANKETTLGIDLANRLIDNPEIPENQKITARFMLGHLLDASGEYDRAFEAFRVANTYRHPGPPTHAESMIELWDKSFHEDLKPTAVSSAQPVIIIGMPRSGTTLTEQIINAHPEAGTVGEAPLLLQQFLRTAPSNLTTELLTEYAEEYLAYINEQTTGTPSRVIDKHMNAERTTGIIAKMFPNAKFIHCLRDPADCCLSAFFQNFGYNLPYARDLRYLGQQYVAHRKLVDHWHETIDRPIYANVYEELVDDPDTKVRSMLEHLDLPFDESCLRFHESKQHVMTASATQVRKPIYASSKQRWRNYEKHLAPLFEALGEYAPV